MTPFESAARDHANSRASTGTRYLYNLDLDRWLAWCVTAGVDPAKPKLADASRFADALKQGQSDQSVRRILGALSSMYEAAMAQETPLASWNPFKKLPRPPKYNYSQTEAVPDDVAEKIFEQVRVEAAGSDIGKRDLALFRIMYDTGLRISSVVRLERGKLVRRKGVLVARDVFIKGNSRGEAELPASADSALQAWLPLAPESKYVFPAMRNGGCLQRSAANKRLVFYARQARVGHVHPHQFRAAYITGALDAGVSLNDVQKSVHHSSPVTTQRYDRGLRGAGVAEAVARARRGK